MLPAQERQHTGRDTRKTRSGLIYILMAAVLALIAFQFAFCMAFLWRASDSSTRLIKRADGRTFASSPYFRTKSRSTGESESNRQQERGFEPRLASYLTPFDPVTGHFRHYHDIFPHFLNAALEEASAAHYNKRVVIPMSELCNYSTCDSIDDFLNEPWYVNQARYTAIVDYRERCHPMANWQTQHIPTCNSIHEIPLQEAASGSFLLSNNGYWRTAWGLPDGHEETPDYAVLKMLRLEKTFDKESFFKHAAEIAVMDRMTSSPYVVNAYGFCGQTLLSEYCDEIKDKIVRNKNVTHAVRLRVALGIVRALVELHSIDFPNASKPSFAHTDLSIKNIALTKEKTGKPQRIILNDFNTGIPIRWDPRTNETCAYPPRNERRAAPEVSRKVRRKGGSSVTAIDPAALDLFRLGHSLYALGTFRSHVSSYIGDPLSSWVLQHYLFHNGDEPVDTTDIEFLSLAAVLFAALACTQEEPLHRPNAYELLQALEGAQQLIQEQPADPTFTGTNSTAKLDQLHAIFEIHAPILINVFSCNEALSSKVKMA